MQLGRAAGASFVYSIRMNQLTFSPLPFSKDALAPFISAETIEFHYEKHHRAYYDKMMKLLPGSGLENASLEEIVKRSEGKLFNNAAQNWNHVFYWDSLKPVKGQKTSGKPDGALLEAINKKFGTFDAFKEKFGTVATDLFGSGWAWLIADGNGGVDIMQTSNADTPIKHGKKPLLTVDVWEHAYYIDYRNARPKYLESMWNVLNWEFAQSNFQNLGASSAHRVA
jgi:Fe-Mn family superoxide dismutase